jgi:hypothetical protein
MSLMFRKLAIVAVVLFTASLSFSVVLDATQEAGHARPTAAARTSPQRAPATVPTLKPVLTGTLPPLPQVSFEPVEPMPVIQQVYEFAARHPEVLSYIPCYCGCEREGHKSNHDCFVKSRDAQGHVTQWDTHGMGCAVCLGVGRQVMAMFNKGMTVQEIRAEIDRTYGTRYTSHTPTPDPPGYKKS